MKLPILIVTLFLVAATVTYSASSALLAGTVKVNICGNSLVETPAEDCEGTDLNNMTCTSLGYGGGDLSCDISCSFVTSNCTPPTPTPSPILSSTPAPSTLPSTVPTTSTLTPSPSPSSIASPTTPLIVDYVNTLPATISSILRQASSSITDRLALSDLEIVVGTWVDSWRGLSSAGKVNEISQRSALCDINEDSSCNTVDLSILLFYFER